MNYLITIGGKKFEVVVNGDLSPVTINGREVKVDYRHLRGGRLYSVLADNVNYEFALERANGGFEAWHGSGVIRVDVSDEKTERLKSLTSGISGGDRASTLKAPMPGLILKIEVEVGQRVRKGDGLLIVEAMKMENELKAHTSGTIKDIKVKPGEPVEKNQVMIVFE
jgi:biotin carboxyl carrier protein